MAIRKRRSQMVLSPEQIKAMYYPDGPPTPPPAPASASVNDLMAAIVADLAEGEVPDPLHHRPVVCYLWRDLCALTGETPPAAVLAACDDDAPRPLALVPPVSRGSYADHAMQFPERDVAEWLPA